jgi:hypothetical protein
LAFYGVFFAVAEFGLLILTIKNKMVLTTTLVASGIALSITGGLWNRIRGGWSKHMENKFMASLTHGFRRVIMALITTLCLYVPFFLLKDNSFFTVNFGWFMGVWITALIVGLLPGWGSWFMIGRDLNSYKHNKDAYLGELIPYLVYGCKWVPEYHQLSYDKFIKLIGRFNIVASPTGSVRPIEWRKKYERLAMAIRGLYITVPAPLVFALHMYFEFGLDLWLISLVFPAGLLMALCYEMGWWIDNDDFLPKFMRSTTEFGEVLAGGTIMTGILYFGSAISLIFS